MLVRRESLWLVRVQPRPQKLTLATTGRNMLHTVRGQQKSIHDQTMTKRIKQIDPETIKRYIVEKFIAEYYTVMLPAALPAMTEHQLLRLHSPSNRKSPRNTHIDSRHCAVICKRWAFTVCREKSAMKTTTWDRRTPSEQARTVMREDTTVHQHLGHLTKSQSTRLVLLQGLATKQEHDEKR